MVPVGFSNLPPRVDLTSKYRDGQIIVKSGTLPNNYSMPSFLILYRRARNDIPNNLAAAVLL